MIRRRTAMSNATPLNLLDNQYSILGTSFSNPLPLGVPFKLRTGRDDVYSMHEIYDVQIALGKIIRGNDALVSVKAQGLTDKPPRIGFEYILAFITITYSRRGKGPGNATYRLMENQLSVYSCLKKIKYTLPDVLKQPKPQLFDHVFHIGESYEGCVLLEVPMDDEKPLLIFRRDSTMGGLTGKWGDIWFQLG
jgi:hypothetical protein